MQQLNAALHSIGRRRRRLYLGHSLCVHPCVFMFARSEDENKKERPWTTDVKICGLTASLLLGLYMRTLHPSVPGGDSGKSIEWCDCMWPWLTKSALNWIF